MRRIERLPDGVANQIAAGEVIERPASAVKELVENAIDAGATRISVEIENGGLGLIRVTDDGFGMSREDALLCLERHATSKIRSATDLDSIDTLGFRGEAVPSIASVSRFLLVTREREGLEDGSRILVEGGTVRDVAAAGAASGTLVEVRDLFYNVPARKKFLKSTATEIGHTSDAITRLALSAADIAIDLRSEGRTLLDVPRSVATDPLGRVGRILGHALVEHLLPIEPSRRGVLDAPGGVSVEGFVSAPDVSERTPRGLYVFVNGRYVRDRTIQHAIQDAYRALLERGRHPVVLLSVRLDPRLVDINVHPQKIEVRFARSQDVHRAVSQAIMAALASAGHSYDHTQNHHHERDHEQSHGPWVRWGLIEGEQAVLRDADASHSSRPSDTYATRPSPLMEQKGRFGSLDPVGLVLGTYLVCQGPGRLVLIDREAAHQRVVFSRMRNELRKGELRVQPLIVPLTIDLDPSRSRVAASKRSWLLDVGFEIEAFGGETWVLKSSPSSLGPVDLLRLLPELLDELKSAPDRTSIGESSLVGSSMGEIHESLLFCASRRAVLETGGDRFRSGVDPRALLSSMDALDTGERGPHAKPIFLEWTDRELATMFQ